MKKLRNNFTTPEQSKRLLALGVPANSADCFYDADDVEMGYYYVFPIPYWKTFEDYSKQEIIPCWSVGRLIEIYNIICDRFPGMELQLGFIPSELQTFTDYIIKKIEYAFDNIILSNISIFIECTLIYLELSDLKK